MGMIDKKWILLGLLLVTLFFVTRTSFAGIKKIISHEGLRLKPYKDEGGKWTIGFGHLIKPNEQYLLNSKGITEEKAKELLFKDLEETEKAIKQLVKVPLNKNQFDALVSFVFNVGKNAFAQSTLLRKINNNQIKDAANEFDRWIYVSGQKSPVLERRREKEKDLFLSI